MVRLGLVTALAVLLVACGREAPPRADLSPKPVHVPTETAPPRAAAAQLAPAAQGEVLVEGRQARVKPSVEHERKVDEARRAVDVTIYGASWCPSCRQARAWLDAHGVAYQERDIDRSEEASRAARRLNPAGTIPVIDIEGDVLVGFAPEALDRTIRKKAELKIN